MIDQPEKRSCFLNPVTKFFINKFFFCTHKKDSEDVVAEEAAFVRNIGAILTYTYSIAVCLNRFTPVLAMKVNAALTVSSLDVHGISEFVGKIDISDDGRTQPGLFKGRYGELLTLVLTDASLVMGYMSEHDKLYVPKFWTIMWRRH